MNIRPAAPTDKDAIHELWTEFVSEVPEPEGFAPDGWDADWAEIEKHIAGGGAAFVAEDGDELVGFLAADAVEAGRWHVETVHVRPSGRRQGVAKALLRACTDAARSAGATYLSLEVLTTNQLAEGVWRRLGFEPGEIVIAQPLDALDLRLGTRPAVLARLDPRSDRRLRLGRACGRAVPAEARRPDRPRCLGRLDPHPRPGLRRRPRRPRPVRPRPSDRLGAVVVALALEVGAVVRLRLYERGRMVDSTVRPGLLRESGHERRASRSP